MIGWIDSFPGLYMNKMYFTSTIISNCIWFVFDIMLVIYIL